MKVKIEKTCRKNSTEFPVRNCNKRYSRSTKEEFVYAEGFSAAKRDLLDAPVHGKKNGILIDELKYEIENHNTNIHSSAKFLPIQAIIKSNEKDVNIIKDRREKRKPNFKIG